MNPDEHITWNGRLAVPNAISMMSSFAAAGLPLSGSEDTGTDDGEGSTSIVCIGSVVNSVIHAVIACPNGSIYRFEPEVLEMAFWRFAARNYYWVTGNMADRQQIAELTNIPVKEIKGKAIARKKSSDVSGMSLDDLIAALGFTDRPAQADLFS